MVRVYATRCDVLCCCSQAVGIRFIGFRNEQAAGYAAAACGFLTGVPGVLLTVSGPGAVHGIAGLSHAGINCWPMIMLSGSSEQVRSSLSLADVPPSPPPCRSGGLPVIVS